MVKGSSGYKMIPRVLEPLRGRMEHLMINDKQDSPLVIQKLPLNGTLNGTVKR